MLGSLVIAGLVACSTPPVIVDAGVDAGHALTPVDVCERLAAARCALKNRCSAAFARASVETCPSVEQSRCLAEYETLRSSFDDGLVRIDNARVESCETRMESSACPPSFPLDSTLAVARPFADCGWTTGLVIGAVPALETCINAIECAPGTVCVKPGGVCRGTCSTSPVAGEPCAFGCAPGLICSSTNTCVAPRPLDAPCASSAQCESDLICLSGACRPRRKVNERCVFDPERLSPCEPGLACDVAPFVDGASGTCIVPRSLGGTCRFHWSCQPGLLCADIGWGGFPASEPTPGNCRPPDGVSFNCAFTPYAQLVGDQCGPGLSCRQSTQVCTRNPTTGEACTPSTQNCTGLDVHCKPNGSGDVGICTGPAAVGERCAFQLDANRTVTIPCAAGACDQTTTFTCRPPSKTMGALCEENGECLSGRCAVQQDRSRRCSPAC
ncbi:MAG: hypothetical protein JNG84_03410 [Archangium sp.]|nr:hypothetical protein [Archangium sp.]